MEHGAYEMEGSAVEAFGDAIMLGCMGNGEFMLDAVGIKMGSQLRG